MEQTTSNRLSRSDGPDPVAGSDADPATPPEANGERIRIVAIDGAGRPVECAGLDALETAYNDPGFRFWVDVSEPDAATLERIGAIVGLHPLVVESIAERNQRAKVERLEDNSLHLILFALRYEGEVVESEVDFVLSERYLLTVHDASWDPRAAPQLRPGPEESLATGPDYLLYAITDWIVDGYFPVMDRLTDEIDALQDEVVSKTSSWDLERLFVLKRELIGIRRATAPTREMFNQLTNRELGLVQQKHVIYFRDVYDHLIRVTDELDNYRELVSGTLDVYLSSVNNNLSNIMKRLTGVTVILAGIGAVAGLFGMSEAGLAFSGGEASGFWMVVALTVIGAAGVTLFLRRIDWI
jgi:magnesium transporter